MGHSWTLYFCLLYVIGKHKYIFNTNSGFIKFVGPQAAKLIILLERKSGHNAASPQWTSLRTHNLLNRKINKPSTQQDANPRPLGYKAGGLPLCYNHNPLGTTLTTKPQPRGKNCANNDKRSQHKHGLRWKNLFCFQTASRKKFSRKFVGGDFKLHFRSKRLWKSKILVG